MTHQGTASSSEIIRISLTAVAMVLLMSGPAAGQSGNASELDEAELNIIRGVVKPSSEAVLSSQVDGRIERLPLKDGQRFKKGRTLVWLDCTKYEAQLAAALAEHEARKKTLQNYLSLSQLKAIGKLDVEISKAEVKKALAAIRIARINVRGCRVKAPFTGRVVRVMVNEHENVSPNDPLLSILDDRHLEMELVMSSRSLAWIKKGTRFKFEVDETGKQYPAKVREIGASVDPVSQTIRVIGVFKKTPKDVLAGMSGSATFPGQAP